MKKTTAIKLGMFKYLLFVPLFLLSFCQSEFDDPLFKTETKLTKDAKVLSLMKSAIQTDSNEDETLNKGSLFKSTDAGVDDQCTHFLYPMTFEVYSGDNPTPVIWEINSDEELISFIDTLVASSETYEFYIHFPITLLDTDGVETVLKDLTELEGTLQMAVEACASLNEDSTGGSDDATVGSNDSSGGSDDSSGGSDDSSGGSDDSTGGSDDSTGSSDDSSGGSDDSSGGSDDSTGGSDGSDDDESNEGSDDDSDIESNDEIAHDNHDNHEEYEFCGKNNKKVYICHKGITICVSVNAIWGHMQHHEEDYLGRCDDD